MIRGPLRRESEPAMDATALEFDLDRYLRASKRVDLTGLRWDRIEDHPLPVEEARVLA